MLCDAAQAAEGKLNILGGGWSVTGPGPLPSAIAALVQVPWDQANQQHEWQLELVDSDGEPVLLPTEEHDEDGAHAQRANAGEHLGAWPEGMTSAARGLAAAQISAAGASRQTGGKA